MSAAAPRGQDSPRGEDLPRGEADSRSDAQPELARYRAIFEHAQYELELAGRGEIADLAVLGARWDALVDGLPAPPPPAAAELLEHARLMHERTRIGSCACARACSRSCPARRAHAARPTATRASCAAARGWIAALSGAICSDGLPNVPSACYSITSSKGRAARVCSRGSEEGRLAR